MTAFRQKRRNLSALISKRGGEEEAGASLGVQNAANSLGQAGGPLLGGVLFIWQTSAPYLFSGALLLELALIIGWKRWAGSARLQRRRVSLMDWRCQTLKEEST